QKHQRLIPTTFFGALLQSPVITIRFALDRRRVHDRIRRATILAISGHSRSASSSALSVPRSLCRFCHKQNAGLVRHLSRFQVWVTTFQVAIASLANTQYEIGDWDASDHCKNESERAYSNLVRFVSRLVCAEEKLAFEIK